MTTSTPETLPAPRPSLLRHWPALVLVVLGVALYFTPNLLRISPELPLFPLIMAYSFGPMLCALLVVCWWLVAGEPRFLRRLLVVAVAAVIGAAGWFAADPSILGSGSMMMKGIPGAIGAATLALLIPSRLPGTRTVVALVLGVAALLPWDLMRQNGVTGSFALDLTPRWKALPEDRAKAYALANAASTEGTASSVAVAASTGDWPGFRGPKRDGVVPVGVGDWAAVPPKELWRHPVGPGWSSVCVVGDQLFTQEQLGDEELVVCYRVSDGKRLWKHADQDRYTEAMSGPGPRATPTFHDGKVYALSVRGVLNCLDAAKGTVIWSEDLKKEGIGATVPHFGMACSPLVVDGKVIVSPNSKEGPRLIAFDAQTSAQVWSVPNGADGYSSPQLSVLAGVPQILLYNGDGVFAHDPSKGEELWHYEIKSDQTSPAVTQPMVLPGDKIVIGGGRIGIPSHCIQVTHGAEGWTAKGIWKTIKFSPGYNDFVPQGGFLYGLNAGSGKLVCIEAETGKERWRDGDYGGGQLLLAGDRLVVQAEDGHLALVKATPDAWQEVATVKALDDKTWNHPVIANGRLFVRNGSEIVCFQLGESRP